MLLTQDAIEPSFSRFLVSFWTQFLGTVKDVYHIRSAWSDVHFDKDHSSYHAQFYVWLRTFFILLLISIFFFDFIPLLGTLTWFLNNIHHSKNYSAWSDVHLKKNSYFIFISCRIIDLWRQTSIHIACNNSFLGKYSKMTYR